ncbi:lytic transglycosylase domain-containing protein [Thiothrix nivea]|uniref:Lytic transglycosylase catalytic n=1 Tax=Thiothrix nivea (strain ATCC 35100 / DSM 5205 / JP2) TaxID=870187 RepID=A0A656HJE8_THINJ|nr:lytic transglycosylase domain-containing protein [Thiothrix nivea]EIJ36184.1 Lytic transglycosylase catalytic [Thiothrix nivea DSM 5205]
MIRLKRIIFIILCGFAAAKPALAAGDGCSLAGTVNKRAEAHQDSIQKYADKYGISSDMVKAVIAIESCYNAQAVSPKGAQGLMQLIPATAERFGVADSFDSNQNIHGGTRYLSWLMKRYDGDLYKAIAAYNAGEGAVDKYKGIPPYSETQHYVRRVLTVYNRLSGQAVALPVVTASVGGGKTSVKPEQKALPVGKPGRAGWQVNKMKAPHLYKH